MLALKKKWLDFTFEHRKELVPNTGRDEVEMHYIPRKCVCFSVVRSNYKFYCQIKEKNVLEENQTIVHES